ncbi:unnamed protein product [Brassica napus]|uniref:(rape) hypothetical protein n=1 Tax=Brassica napus TaxID=3708 RepID=A0A816JZ57_BRANA|nr:unnamed protein product [Brassica napus]
MVRIKIYIICSFDFYIFSDEQDNDGNIEGKMVTSKDVWKFQNSRVIVHFDEDSGQPIGESGGLLGSWICQLRNDVNLLPINYSDWRLVSPHIKNKAWEVIQSKFRFDDPQMRKSFVMGALGKSTSKGSRISMGKCKSGILKTRKNIPCLMSVEERVFQEEEMRLKSRPGKHHVEQSFSSRLAHNLMEALYVKKQKNARVPLNCCSWTYTFKLVCRSTANRQDVENSEMVVELKTQVSELSDQVKGMTTFIQQIIGTSTGEHVRERATSFDVAFANIPNPTFANIPDPPDQERIEGIIPKKDQGTSMEEQREESASIGDCKAPLEETGKELGLASKSETLDGEVDVPVKEPCVEDVSDSGVGSVTKDDVEKGVSSDDVVKTGEPETERDAGAVDVKPVNGESAGEEENEVNDEEANHVAEQNVQTEKPQQSSVDGETLSVAEDKAGQEKESGDGSDDANMDVDSKQANEENVGSETNYGKDSESVQVPEESTQETNEENPAAETCGEVDTTHKEENGEAMDVDYTEEETLEKLVLDDAGASMVPTQDVPITEADSNLVKGMEVDERKDDADMAVESANPKSSSEDAAPGEIEQLDQNGLFDPRSDITNFIDFSGVSSWSGNVQDLKTESGNLSSLKEDKKATLTAEEVATEEDGGKVSSHAEGVENESNEAPVATECPEEASDAILGSDENQDGKDQQDTRREEDDTTHEAPSIDQNQQQEDTVMEENPDNSDYAEVGTDSDIKTNGVKRKADVLSEQRPSFKIGACIARAASQMAGSPSVLKGSSNLGDETLSVESFVSQLHSAATDPVKENAVSEIASGFFLRFRNSSASQQFVPEKASSKRGRSNSSAAVGTEAFEFEEMGDTYWTDRVIHNGGEEQTPAATEKENYQVVPVELKPAQVKRTRRPYRRRQSQISYPLPSASDKPADFDENAPAELIMYFSEADAIPSEKSLSKMFRHFGPIRDSQTEVDEEKNRARVVFRKGADADVAYKSAGKFNIFGTKTVNYELSFTITETFKVKPYVVSLDEEEAAVSLPA